MTIKPKLAAILLACLMLGSSMSVGAAKQEQELLEEPAVTMPQAPLQHYPSVPLFIHDVKGNPVSGIVVDHLSNIPCTNEKGQITLDFVDPSAPFILRLSNPANGEYINYKVWYAGRGRPDRPDQHPALEQGAPRGQRQKGQGEG